MNKFEVVLLTFLAGALVGCGQVPIRQDASATPAVALASQPPATPVVTPNTVLAMPSTVTSTVPEAFPADFQAPQDTAGFGKGERIQGWGGAGPVARNPVVFLHGNGTDSRMFRGFAQVFHERYGYQYSELWSFSYQGYPNSGKPENKQTGILTPHDNAVGDVHEMIERILAYTGRSKVTLVTYSLGATLGRHYLNKYDAYDRVDTFVSIVGANHGFQGAEEGGEPEWTPEAIRALCVHPSGDETPYGRSTDEAVHLPPDAHRAIDWIVIHAGKDDYMLNMHLKTWQQVDNATTSVLTGADINASFEGVFSPLEKPFGAHISFYHEMETMFPVLDRWFLD